MSDADQGLVHLLDGEYILPDFVLKLRAAPPSHLRRLVG